MTNQIVLEAIALRKCIQATYNRIRVRLAPHILYRRGEQLFIDAVTIERAGQPPRETKLSTFQVTGLRELALCEGAFQPEASFDPEADKYEGVTLFMVA